MDYTKNDAESFTNSMHLILRMALQSRYFYLISDKDAGAWGKECFVQSDSTRKWGNKNLKLDLARKVSLYQHPEAYFFSPLHFWHLHSCY